MRAGPGLTPEGGVVAAPETLLRGGADRNVFFNEGIAGSYVTVGLVL